MTSRALSEEMLKAGTSAAVGGYPHRKIPDEMRPSKTIGEKTVELRSLPKLKLGPTTYPCGCPPSRPPRFSGLRSSP